mmetsp:Transcript_25451/g.70975  ORF Transcript_25451/g.70975 Transcript_25451/m.70975 type:complete len:451 (+) Transcript_25451:74-1426(+)
MGTQTDRLVGLFLQAALPDGVSSGTEASGALTPEAIERAINATDKMLCSEDALRMGMSSPAPTYVCLAMALEEKPKLEACAMRCYEQSLKYLGTARSWERAVVLQQLGAVNHRLGRHREALTWLAQCAEECRENTGHPRDANLFGGSFRTQQTRLEFWSAVEKWQAQAYHKLGDMEQAHSHLAEAKRLEAAVGGDAIERVAAAAEAASPQERAGSAASGSRPAAADPVAEIKRLWADSVVEEPQLRTYRYTDEGPIVLLILDLNDHLGLGDEASCLVDSLRQFRVTCQDRSVDIRVRFRQDGRARELRLHLNPLAQEIVPEDTVPRLRGREAKRRLEVKLFKRDKQRPWHGDLVGSEAPTKAPAEAGKKTAAAMAPPPPRGTQLNPLSPEELARLPRPSGDLVDNRPSAWQTLAPARAETTETQAESESEPRPAAAPAATAAAPCLEEMD